METLIIVIIVLVALGLFILGVDLYSSVPKQTIEPKQPKQPQKTVTLKARFAKGYSLKNEKQNFQKKQQKARNQGKLQFYFHGEYYPTGLLVVNGGK
jgi:hypothetical protein